MTCLKTRPFNGSGAEALEFSPRVYGEVNGSPLLNGSPVVPLEFSPRVYGGINGSPLQGKSVISI